ncbi:predicted P-loop ATPase fused to an acetyltransferase [Vibrio ponticus]|nr:predicted P-loop ATPase fused to an acetyltransferase [Vibrio ponticus]
MLSEQSFFAQLLKVAQVSHHRFGIVLRGEENWQQQLCFAASQMVEGDCFQLGGEAKTYAQQWRSMSKGQQLLGHECHLLVCDLRAEFDANSITSILGTLCGGGLAIFLHSGRSEGNAAQQWLDRALQQLLVIEQGKPLPSLPSMPSSDVTESASFAVQEQAIGLIKKVVTGHRRRPLVLTADRGRGKTSALGIASAQLMLERNMRVVVTSPNIGNVTPLFDHAAHLLKGAERSKLKLNWQNSSIQFVAPDEVVRGEFECDLLLVDEAAAIPLPMLQSMVAKFHRTVFSSTIHGYEGCGRGFSLKFQAWLEQHRPGCRFFHMQTPIRWLMKTRWKNGNIRLSY